MKYFDTSIRTLFIVCTLIFIGTFARKMTDTFTIAAISSNRPFQRTYQTRLLTQEEERELDLALSQPYHYFGWGGQVYVFFSADGKYVIKFFKQRLFRPSWLLNTLPLPKCLHRYRFKRNWKRQDKLKRDFFSYKASFEELQEQTALLYCHLHRTHHLNRRFELIDRLNIHHFLNLDHFDFIVQRKAERVQECFNRLNGDVEGMREVFREILSLTNQCITKGFYNRDPFIPNNCGFVEGRAIQIDVGRFLKKETIRTAGGHIDEFLRITTPFEQWITAHYPHLLPIYQEQLQEICQQ